MDEKISMPLTRLDEINLSLDRAGAMVDLVFSYAAANNEAHPNLAPGTLVNAMHVIRGELDVIRKELRLFGIFRGSNKGLIFEMAST